MNMWGIVLALAGLVAVYVGVKGDPAGLAKAFAPAGSASAAAPAAATTPKVTGSVTAPTGSPALPGVPAANQAAPGFNPVPANGVIPGANGGPPILIPGMG